MSNKAYTSIPHSRIQNSVIVSGNLGSDPFKLTLKDGRVLSRVLLAQHEYINGVKQLYWFHIILHEEIAEQAFAILRKGQRAGFIGKLISRQYFTESNKMLTITEIEAIEFWVENKVVQPAA
jgi:single-stranded DNA-binding protein